MIRPVSSQLADFLRLGPTPASSDEVGCSAVNRNVGGSNPPRGAKSFLDKHLLTALFPTMKNVVRLSGFSTGRAIRIARKPNVFAEKIIGSVPTIRFATECLEFRRHRMSIQHAERSHLRDSLRHRSLPARMRAADKTPTFIGT